MKNKSLFLNHLLGGCIFFVLFVLVFLLFQKWDLFDLYNRSFKSIIIEAIVISVVFSVFMFLYSTTRLKKKQKIKQ